MSQTTSISSSSGRAADSALFGLTVSPCLPLLRARARAMSGNDADAQDLVQETLERALRTFARFRPGTAAAAWLLTIMRSVWIDAWRRRCRGLAVVPVASGDVDAAAPEPEPPSFYELADVIVRRLPEMVARLPPKLRVVIELRLGSAADEASYRAIAARLGLPARTVGTRLLRARRRLAEILEDDLPRLRAEAALETLAEIAPSLRRPAPPPFSVPRAA